MVTKTINSTRLDLYRKYVDQAEGKYPFESRYELFSLAAVLGFLDGTRYTPQSEDVGYSQDFVKVDDIQDQDHRSAINFIYNLVAIDLVHDDDEDIEADSDNLKRTAWTRTKEYADQGLTILDNELGVQGQIDLVRLLNNAEDDWPDRTCYVSSIFDDQQ